MAFRLRGPISAFDGTETAWRPPGSRACCFSACHGSLTTQGRRATRVSRGLSCCLPLRGTGSAPWREFSKLNRRARRCPCLRFRSRLATTPARLRVRMESLAPFLQGSCIPVESRLSAVLSASTNRSPHAATGNHDEEPGRFPPLLIEPCMRFARTRLSDGFHAKACAGGPSWKRRNWKTPSSPNTRSAGKRCIPREGTLCRRRRKCRTRS